MHPFEDLTQITFIRKTTRPGNGCDGKIGLRQQYTNPFKAGPLQLILQGPVHHSAEALFQQTT